mgnify:FL=1
MSSLLYTKIKNNACFKWQFLGRRSHVDYVKSISYSIMDRYSRRYVLYNDKAVEIVTRVSGYISSDPIRTAKAITQYFGFGRYVDGDWEISSYGFNPLKNADHYTELLTRKEIDLDKGRSSYCDALALAPIEYKELYDKYPKGWLNECGVCGVIGSFKLINFKSNLYGWSEDSFLDGCHYEKTLKANMCISCWNKLKPIQKKEIEVREIKSLTNKLNRERLKWLKSQTLDN